MDMTELLLTIACCMMVALVYLSPAMAFCRAWSVIAYSPYGYLFTLVSMGLWVMYALDWGLQPLGWLSGIGACFAAIYIGIFLMFSDHADRRHSFLLRWTVGGTVFLFVAVVFHFIVGGKSTVFNVACCAAACFSSVAPFYKAWTAWEERSMRTMPSIFIPGFTLPNAVLLILRNTIFRATQDVDWYLLVASGVAAMSAFLQLLMHVKFWTPPPPGDLEQHLIDHDSDDSGSSTDSEESGSSTDSEGSAQGEHGDHEQGLGAQGEHGDHEQGLGAQGDHGDHEQGLGAQGEHGDHEQGLGAQGEHGDHEQGLGAQGEHGDHEQGLGDHEQEVGDYEDVVDAEVPLPPAVLQQQFGVAPLAPVQHHQQPENAVGALPPPVQQHQPGVVLPLAPVQQQLGVIPPGPVQQQQQGFAVAAPALPPPVQQQQEAADGPADPVA